MSRQTKILVLHMKELVYTAIFLVLAAILVILLVTMFSGKDKAVSASASGKYIAGVYTSSITFGNRSVDVRVAVDENCIKDISLVDLDESVTVMYPLMQPTVETLRSQIVEKQSLDDITCETANQYTSAVIMNAISDALEKAAPSNS